MFSSSSGQAPSFGGGADVRRLRGPALRAPGTCTTRSPHGYCHLLPHETCARWMRQTAQESCWKAGADAARPVCHSLTGYPSPPSASTTLQPPRSPDTSIALEGHLHRAPRRRIQNRRMTAERYHRSYQRRRARSYIPTSQGLSCSTAMRWSSCGSSHLRMQTARTVHWTPPGQVRVVSDGTERCQHFFVGLRTSVVHCFFIPRHSCVFLHTYLPYSQHVPRSLCAQSHSHTVSRSFIH